MIKLEVETSALRKELISRTLIKEMLGQLSSIDRNEVLTIGGQLAPEIAGILGNGDAKEIQKIKDLIESKCYKAIQHKQALIGDFLKKILADSKDDKKRKRKSA